MTVNPTLQKRMPHQKPGKKSASPDRLWIRILEKTEPLAKNRASMETSIRRTLDIPGCHLAKLERNGRLSKTEKWR
jgi:hypothetical protein